MRCGSLWLPRALIPNRDGLRIRILTTDGLARDATVRRGSDGLHRLSDTPIVDVVGWLPYVETSRASR